MSEPRFESQLPHSEHPLAKLSSPGAKGDLVQNAKQSLGQPHPGTYFLRYCMGARDWPLLDPFIVDVSLTSKMCLFHP